MLPCFFIFILPSLSLYLLLSLYNPSECLASRAADNRLVQVLTPSRSGVSSYRSLTSAKIDSSFTVCTRQIDIGCFRLNTFDIVRSRETGAIVCKRVVCYFPCASFGISQTTNFQSDYSSCTRTRRRQCRQDNSTKRRSFGG